MDLQNPCCVDYGDDDADDVVVVDVDSGLVISILEFLKCEFCY